MRNSNKTETMGMVLTAGDGDDLEYFFSDGDVFYKSYESTNKPYSLKFLRHNVTSLMIC